MSSRRDALCHPLPPWKSHLWTPSPKGDLSVAAGHVRRSSELKWRVQPKPCSKVMGQCSLIMVNWCFSMHVDCLINDDSWSLTMVGDVCFMVISLVTDGQWCYFGVLFSIIVAGDAPASQEAVVQQGGLDCKRFLFNGDIIPYHTPHRWVYLSYLSLYPERLLTSQVHEQNELGTKNFRDVLCHLPMSFGWLWPSPNHYAWSIPRKW